MAWNLVGSMLENSAALRTWTAKTSLPALASMLNSVYSGLKVPTIKVLLFSVMEKPYQHTFGSFKTTLTILLLFSSVLQKTVFAQKEKNIWYFGGNAAQGPTSGSGIDFNTSPPTLLTTSGMYSNEGSAVMSDKATGALLFYTNGTTIYNANHQPMANGTGLNGNTSATQSSLIVPVPCSTTQYYVFTLYSQAIFNGLSYSMVDMTLNGGLGGVTTKNVSLSSQYVTEKLTVVKHSNGQDYWLIYHSFPNCPPFNPQATSAQFNVRLISTTGVGPATPYNAGTPYIDLGNTSSNPATLGYLQPSHDCSMLAAAVHNQDVIDILNFNNATGAITSKYSFAPGHTEGYGVEFSPDNTKLYFSTGNSATANAGILAQFDLSAGTSAAIAASKQIIFSYASPADGGGGALQLAPDGKIYFARTANPGLNYLSVINNPDGLGMACNFVQQGFMLGAKFSSLGLPNFLQEGCYTDTLIADFDTLIACVGNPSSFPTNITGTLGGGATFSWSFGDGGFSNVQNPSHTYTSPGQYLVTLTIQDGCKKIVIQKKITVTGTSAPTITGNTTICPGGVATLTASGGGGSSYSWNTGATTAAISVSPATTTTYSVAVSSGGCSGTASVTVTVGGALSPVITGNTTICSGQATTLTASGGSTYSWNNGSTTASIQVSPSSTTSYSVLVSMSGCSGSATTTVTVSGALSPVITGNNTICPGSTATLNASGGSNYSWSNGSTNASIQVSPTSNTTYSVLVSAGNCTGTATATVTVGSLPPPVITGNPIICTGDMVTLTASGGSSYVWNTGASTASITDSPATTTTYSVTASSGNGCTSSGTFTVSVTGAITAIVACQDVCGGSSAILTASGGSNYLWSTGAVTNSITVSPAAATTYSVVASAGSCTDTASCTVNVFPAPVISVFSDTTIPSSGSATLTATGGTSYLWSNGATGNVISVSPVVTTQYSVTVTDGNGCTSVGYVTVTVDNPCDFSKTGELFVPNAFSPNDDGENDVLQIYYGNINCLERVVLNIYDRWGEKIFEASELNPVWDGTYKGRKLNPATFTFFLKATLINGDEIIKRGNISLMK